MSLELAKIVKNQAKKLGISHYFKPKLWSQKFNNKKNSLVKKIKGYVKEENLVEVLRGMVAFEFSRNAGPRLAANYIEKHLDNSEGLEELRVACEAIFEENKKSVYLTYLYCVTLAKAENYEYARNIISDAIIDSRKKSTRSFFGDSLARKRSVSFIKIWRVLDLIARENMTWLNDGEDGYQSEEWLQDYSVDDYSALDSQLMLFFAEPLLQGKHEEKYINSCRLAFKEAGDVVDKLKVIFAVRRQGIRRLKSYHKPYAVAREFYEEIRNELNNIVDPLIKRRPSKSIAPVGLSRLLRQFMVVAKELNYYEDVEKIEKALKVIGRSSWGKSAVWLCAYSLMEINGSKNLNLTKKMVETTDLTPKSSKEIADYMNWANLAQEYDAAEEFFREQSPKVKSSKEALIYAKILQRLGKFGEAAKITKNVHSVLLARPHNICPFTSWNLVKRVGELEFLTETAEIYSMVPQPTEPEGVIFITARSIEQLRKYPLVVMMELKRQGWAIIPLVEGLLPLEKTGQNKIDKYIGCLSISRDMKFKDLKKYTKISNFEYDLNEASIKWNKVDVSHGLWEEAAINRRIYNIDYTCPALEKYLGGVVKWTENCAVILEDIDKKLRNKKLKIGFLIQFNSRLPDLIFRSYCEEYGDKDEFFCLHSANGYQNYFSNFSTNVSTKGIMRNMTRHPEMRSGSFPVPSSFEEFYEKNKKDSLYILDLVSDVTKVKRSTAGQKELPVDAKLALAKIQAWRDKGGKVACAFGKVVCDSSVPYDGGPAHKSMKDWINHTIESVKDSNTLLLIKPHPHELNESIACFINEYFLDLIETELPDNVILVGHKWFDIHMLKDFVDIGLIYNGTTSVELGLLEIPSILCSYFAPVDYPVGHVVPRDKEHYKQMVRGDVDLPVKPDLKERSACWLYYMSSEEVVLDYRYHARPITNKVLYPSYWFEEDIRNYLINGDENVVELARRATG